MQNETLMILSGGGHVLRSSVGVAHDVTMTPEMSELSNSTISQDSFPGLQARKAMFRQFRL